MVIYTCSKLTLSIPEKLKNSISEIPIIPQTLNINNLRTTNAKSINLDILESILVLFKKRADKGNVYLLTFSRYCCSKVGRYYHLPSGVQGTKGLILAHFSPMFHIYNHRKRQKTKGFLMFRGSIEMEHRDKMGQRHQIDWSLYHQLWTHLTHSIHQCSVFIQYMNAVFLSRYFYEALTYWLGRWISSPGIPVQNH